jgi:hypothetical protein
MHTISNKWQSPCTALADSHSAMGKGKKKAVASSSGDISNAGVRRLGEVWNVAPQSEFSPLLLRQGLS